MSLQTAFGINLAIRGDGKSDKLKIDLLKTPVKLLDGGLGMLPRTPDSILSISIGGPGISHEMKSLVEASLDKNILTLNFSVPLLDDEDLYTVEVVFGYEGV